MAVVSASELLSLARACIEAAGASQEAADVAAQVLIDADLRGVSSHGVNRLEMYCLELERRMVDGHAVPIVENDAPASALVNGMNAPGAYIGDFCMKLAIQKAREAGVGWVTVRNSNHFGGAGFYARMAATAGMVGFAFTNTSPVGVPTHASVPALGTNPIACAGPTLSHPVVVDMATTTVPLGRVEVCRRKGEECPEGWGVDSDGEPTTNPDRILNGGGMTYLGSDGEASGHKGYGLSLMVEMLCGVMADASTGPAVCHLMNPLKPRTAPANLGQCFVAIDVERLCPGYPTRLQNLADELRDLPPARTATGPVRVPGDRSHENTTFNSQNGIMLHENIAASVVRVCAKYSVPLPPALTPINTPEGELQVGLLEKETGSFINEDNSTASGDSALASAASTPLSTPLSTPRLLRASLMRTRSGGK
eukprot:m.27557 g.27557  ORF g.27557 m.27557 type:complete len:424 (+) comp9024_c1_seq1:44-1315(+)